MKILDILINEDFGTNSSKKYTRISLNDLNSLQLRTLKRLQDKTVDIETASTKELDIITDLIDMGLVDADGNVIVDIKDKKPNITHSRKPRLEDEYDFDDTERAQIAKYDLKHDDVADDFYDTDDINLALRDTNTKLY